MDLAHTYRAWVRITATATQSIPSDMVRLKTCDELSACMARTSLRSLSNQFKERRESLSHPWDTFANSASCAHNITSCSSVMRFKL
jgi:hypothetical protein